MFLKEVLNYLVCFEKVRLQARKNLIRKNCLNILTFIVSISKFFLARPLTNSG